MKKLNQLNKLADMIRANDEALFDEINARVHHHSHHKGTDYCGVSNFSNFYKYKGKDQYEISVCIADISNYIQSIDDQAAIMPEGWYIKSISQHYKHKDFHCFLAQYHKEIESEDMPTEAQARLLAIVLVWIYLEENK